MEMRILEKARLSSLLDKIIEDNSVIGVKEKKGKYVYEQLNRGDQFCPDFDLTTQSPKRFVFPPRETLLNFSDAEKVDPCFDSEFQVIWGVHPYDIKAINVLDLMFQSTNEDRHYLSRRENTFVVGIDPVRASEKAFWGTMDADTVEDGFDLFLADIGEEYVVSVGTERGRKMLKKYGVSTMATESHRKRKDEVQDNLKNLCSPERKLHFSLEALPYLLMRADEADVWKEKAEKCFSCGSCNLVCPTCYCFDVQDEVSTDFKEGQRIRVWDGCLLQDFASVATGENFRENKYERYRHRFYRKGLYIRKKYGEFACVGCGRCAIACLPDIADPVEVYNRVFNYLKGALVL